MARFTVTCLCAEWCHVCTEYRAGFLALAERFPQAEFRWVDIEEEVKQKPAVQRLIAQVERYGGKYFSADTVRQLRTTNAALESLEKGSLRSRAVIRNIPAFQWFAIPALGLLVAALILRAVPYFSDYT